MTNDPIASHPLTSGDLGNGRLVGWEWLPGTDLHRRAHADGGEPRPIGWIVVASEFFKEVWAKGRWAVQMTDRHDVVVGLDDMKDQGYMLRALAPSALDREGRRSVALEDLSRGMLVCWNWLPGMQFPMKAKDGSDPRPIGRVVSQEDLPHMSTREGPLNIQLLDCEHWLIAPKTVLRRGNPIYAVDPAEVAAVLAAIPQEPPVQPAP